MASEREREIRRRRHRKAKLKKLRKRLAEARTLEEREYIIERIRRVSPFAPIEMP